MNVTSYFIWLHNAQKVDANLNLLHLCFCVLTNHHDEEIAHVNIPATINLCTRARAGRSALGRDVIMQINASSSLEIASINDVNNFITICARPTKITSSSTLTNKIKSSKLIISVNLYAIMCGKCYLNILYVLLK